MSSTEGIAVIGGGPTGYSAALFLTGQGIPVTLLEQSDTIYADPRAATFHPPTLELLAASGITEQLHEIGIIARRWQFRDRHEGLIAEFDLGLLAGETAFPYRLQCEQHKLVGLVADLLDGNTLLTVIRGAQVTDLSQADERVSVHYQRAGEAQTLSAPFVVGADGGRSVARKSQRIGFQGFTYPERFLVVTTRFDLELLGYAYSNYTADPERWCASFKVPGDGPPGLWRVVFPTEPREDEAQLLDHGQAQSRLQDLIGPGTTYEIVHTNLYQVHQRVASTYRRGRVLLAGDAAHVNNPLGGMGMNFGVHDAANLADKLGAVWRGEADFSLLDRYDRQRRTVAEDFLQSMTIQNKKNLEEKDPAARRSRMDEMRRIAADPKTSRTYLLNTSMITGFRAAAAID